MGSLTIRYGLWAAVAATIVGALSVTATSAPVAAATSPCPSDRLLANHRITGNTECETLRSPLHHFVLGVGEDGIGIQQWVTPTGEPAGSNDALIGQPTWVQQTPYDARYTHLSLWLRPDGNLVLINSSNAILWSSGTTGKGAVQAAMSDNGRLMLLNAAGKSVWSTDSGPSALGAGDRVAPGGHLAQVQHLWQEVNGGPAVRRSIVRVGTMQPDGNYVVQCNSHLYWQTNTHVPGSSLVLRGWGVVVQSPAGKIIWSSPPLRGTGLLSIMGDQVFAGNGSDWTATPTPGATC